MFSDIPVRIWEMEDSMHRIYILLLLIAPLFFSCTGNSNAPTETISIDISEAIANKNTNATSVSDPISIEHSNTAIEITGLESGKIYTIYTETSSNVKTSSNRVNPLETGTYIFRVPSGETAITFTSQSIGLGNGGELRIGDVVTPDITFEDGTNGLVIGKGSSEPIFTNDDGSSVYEAFCAIDLSTFPDLENMVVTAVISYNGPTKLSYWFRFVDENGKEIPDFSGNSLINLSKMDEVYLYAQLTTDGNGKYHIYLTNPETIEMGENLTISSPKTYLIEPSPASFLVIDNPSGNLGIFNDALNARYAESGKHFSFVFPIELSDNEIIVNIPAHTEPIMFDYRGDNRTVHLEEAPSGFSIAKMGKGTKTFTVNEGTFLYPVIFEDNLYGAVITLETESNIDARLGLAHESGNGYATDTLTPGVTYNAREDRKLEYFFFRNDEGKACTFTLTVK